ncbi:hypothetical protein Zm00014a_036190 [Zea mays]|uniref:Uncharacterized protein n=1 Tax=Zea mays TaxID=4577 RepID=A0A3L6DX77_MAIZE|nr:hypothetical protein Zm00014a_036190 [Zea mays]
MAPARAAPVRTRPSASAPVAARCPTGPSLIPSTALKLRSVTRAVINVVLPLPDLVQTVSPANPASTAEEYTHMVALSRRVVTLYRQVVTLAAGTACRSLSPVTPSALDSGGCGATGSVKLYEPDVLRRRL